MANSLSVSCDQISNTSSSATIRCTISANGTYFGLLSPCIAIKDWNGYKNYWGFPLPRNWKSSWHASPDYRLANGQNYNGPYGNLACRMDNRTYTWESVVPINRGNSRTGSAEVTVGLVYNGTDSRFGTALATRTLYTTSIPYGEITYTNCSVDDSNASGDRYIRIHTVFTNPESFHYCRLTDSNGKILAISGESATSLDHNILISKDMYQTTKAFKVELFGKDNKACPGAKTITAYIEPSGVGLWIKQDSNAKEVSSATFKNVKNKQITEVWIKKDGEWKKTIK